MIVSPYVKHLRIHPVKSCGVVDLYQATVTERGLMSGAIGDRRWILFQPSAERNNPALTQREAPRLTLVKQELMAEGNLPPEAIRLSSQGFGEITLVPDQVTEECVTITLHRKPVVAHCVGTKADQWFSGYVGRPVRLAYQLENDLRHASPNYAPEGTLVSMADGFAFTISNQGTLDFVNADQQKPLHHNNFRSNIVIDGAEARAENGWDWIRIGEAEFKLVKPCTRCEMTTIDLETGMLPTIPYNRAEPLATLFRTSLIRQTYGNEKLSGVVYSENAIALRPGTIHAGQEIEVLTGKAPPQWILPRAHL